jgi:glycerol-3-phosphate dehydrogenase
MPNIRSRTAPRLHRRRTRLPLRLRQPVFREPVTPADVVWSYSGVRPLYDDGASSATAATRDYTLKVDRSGGRAGAQHLWRQDHDLPPSCRSRAGQDRGAPAACRGRMDGGRALPGGDFPHDGRRPRRGLMRDYPFLTEVWARRLIRAYGTEAREVLGGATQGRRSGPRFRRDPDRGGGRLAHAREYARTAEDVLWRRSKLGLRLSAAEARALDDWMTELAGATDRTRRMSRTGIGAAAAGDLDRRVPLRERETGARQRGGDGHGTYPGARSGHDIEPRHRLSTAR